MAKKWRNFWKIWKMMVMRSHSTFMEGWSWAVIRNIVWWLPMTIIFFFSKKDGHRKPPTSHFWWHPMTILVIYRKMMVMGSQQSPVFDDCLWPSFLEKRKMMVIGSQQTLVFYDCPWPSFHIHGMTSHDHHFLNFSKINPFLAKILGF